ncbi:hypothetical protein [Paenibacillus sp. OV219]|uniref:hypothetical protein n=1 Tax=Paenibacillus sp. OV219 TaxID=1884377 RepID=UPI0008D13736|nr:hypothetical protein [Paenibacillus sp. OV219]SEP15658.1 hypothetical protein SAMN05518847_12115 [Paenibacillus sp. OV219]
MTMRPRHRKIVTIAHITTSVGWLGAATCFFSLAIAGLKTENAQMVLAAYQAMDMIAQFVIVPFCLGTFFTGLILSLGTEWGLFRYYWILVKLLLTIICTLGLLVHLNPIRNLARLTTINQSLISTDLHNQIQLLVIAGAAILLLIFATTLSVLKPKGVTPFGWRKQ